MATSPISTTGPLFQAGGLASGLDTNSIVNSIITADSAAMTQVQSQQAAYQVQISTVATLTTKLQLLQTAADALATSGLAPIQANSTYADFTVSGSATSEGNSTVKVSTLALAAKFRSGTSFSSAQTNAGLTGSLQFSIDGVTSPSTAISLSGRSLSGIAEAINKQVPQVTASVVSDGSKYYLSVTRNSTGYATSDADPSDALKVVGSDPGFSFQTIQPAQNASLTVDGLSIQSQSNTITGAIPGVTLSLTGQSNVATNVTFASNSSSAATDIQNFISAYNDVVTVLNSQLRPDPSQAATNNPLAGASLLSLESDMQGLLSKSVGGTGVVQSLSDLNVSMQDDGTLMLDQLPNQKTFAQAIAADPSGANKLFTTAKTGIAALVDSLVAKQTDPVDGALVGETSLLKSNISSLDETVSYWQTYLDNERTRLTAEFTAMEATIANLNTASNYLNALSSSSSGSSGYTYKTTSKG
jgi:flagellar hook-associated protein 2